MVFDPIFDENASIFVVNTVIFIIFKNQYFPGVLEVILNFHDKFFFYINDCNKCPFSGKKDEKCIFRKSYFHQIQPRHRIEGKKRC